MWGDTMFSPYECGLQIILSSSLEAVNVAFEEKKDNADEIKLRLAWASSWIVRMASRNHQGPVQPPSLSEYREQFHAPAPKFPLQHSLCSSIPFVSSPLATTGLFSIPAALSFSEGHINEIIENTQP